MQVEGLEITVEDLVGSTGLEMKVDPGIPYVYAGFAGNLLMTSSRDTLLGCQARAAHSHGEQASLFLLVFCSQNESKVPCLGSTM